MKELNKPLLLAGDFNNPAGQEGYQAILASPLGLQDAFEVAQEKSGSYTVPPEIDGWKGNTEPPSNRLCFYYQRVRGGKFTCRI